MKEIRTCIACRAKKKKHELIRIVKCEEKVLIDEKHNINSRGMYICNSLKCLERLEKNKNIEKVIKLDITKDELIESIRLKLGEKQIGKN